MAPSKRNKSDESEKENLNENEENEVISVSSPSTRASSSFEDVDPVEPNDEGGAAKRRMSSSSSSSSSSSPAARAAKAGKKVASSTTMILSVNGKDEEETESEDVDDDGKDLLSFQPFPNRPGDALPAKMAAAAAAAAAAAPPRGPSSSSKKKKTSGNDKEGGSHPTCLKKQKGSSSPPSPSSLLSSAVGKKNEKPQAVLAASAASGRVASATMQPGGGDALVAADDGHRDCPEGMEAKPPAPGLPEAETLGVAPAASPGVPASVGKAKPPPSSTASPKAKAGPTSTRSSDNIGSSGNAKKLSFQEGVHQHMMSRFKPFLLKDMAKELKTSEKTLEYTMLSLVDKGWVCSKEFEGKKVKALYWANHDARSKDDRPASEQTIQEARERLALVQSDLQSVEGQLARVLEVPSNDQLASMIEKGLVELDELRDCIAGVRERIDLHQVSSSSSNSTAPVPSVMDSATGARKGRRQASAISSSSSSSLASSRRHGLQQLIHRMTLEGRKRKLTCIDFVERVADGMEKKPEEVMKMMEIEGDGKAL